MEKQPRREFRRLLGLCLGVVQLDCVAHLDTFASFCYTNARAVVKKLSNFNDFSDCLANPLGSATAVWMVGIIAKATSLSQL
jgi:hypothetical protein